MPAYPQVKRHRSASLRPRQACFLGVRHAVPAPVFYDLGSSFRYELSIPLLLELAFSYLYFLVDKRGDLCYHFLCYLACHGKLFLAAAKFLAPANSPARSRYRRRCCLLRTVLRSRLPVTNCTHSGFSYPLAFQSVPYPFAKTGWRPPFRHSILKSMPAPASSLVESVGYFTVLLYGDPRTLAHRPKLSESEHKRPAPLDGATHEP